MNDGFFILSKNKNYIKTILDKKIDMNYYETVIVVYHDKYTDKELLTNYNNLQKVYFISFREYDTKIRNILDCDLSKTLMIIHDISRMVSNVLDDRLDSIQFRYKNKTKIVIDPIPYLVYPYRFYFPYSCFDKSLLGYDSSYAFKSAFEKYDSHEDKSNYSDPYNIEDLSTKTYKHTYTDIERIFNKHYEIKYHNVNEYKKSQYYDLKEKLFDSELSISQIINHLYKFTKTCINNHNLPKNLNKLYDIENDQTLFENHEIHATDLPVDIYLANEVINLINHTNKLQGALYEKIYG